MAPFVPLSGAQGSSLAVPACLPPHLRDKCHKMTVKHGHIPSPYPLFLQRSPSPLPVFTFSAYWDFTGTGSNYCTCALEEGSHQCNIDTDCLVSPREIWTVLLYGNLLLVAVVFRDLKFAIYLRGNSSVLMVTLKVKNDTVLPRPNYFLSAAYVMLRFYLGMAHIQKVWSIKCCSKFYGSC